MKKLITLLMLVLLVGLQAFADVNNYTFSQSSGTYTAITGGTVLGSGTFDDNVYNANNIGFNFVLGGVPFNQFSVNANGWLCLGATATSSYNPISAGTSNYVISALGKDLNNDNSTLATLRYELIGSAPNRTLVVQWARVGKYVSGGGTENYNFQIRLNETTNTIDIVYGAMTVNATSGTFEVGLRGASTSVYNNRSTTTDWSATTAGTINTASCTMSNTVYPASGLTFTYTPVASSAPADPTSMTFSAITSTGMTVNWVDNSTDELGFFITRAKDATFTTEVVTSYVASTTAAGTGTGYNSVVTGLFPGTTYYFKVLSYNDGRFSTPGLTGNQASNAPTEITSTATGGLWSATSTWTGGVVPTASDNATIVSGATVTVDATTNTCFNLTIDNGGTVNVASGTTFTLTVNNNLTNNGTFDLYTSGTVYATLAFAGAYNSTFSGTGATTDLGLLTINKGSGTITTTSPTLEMMPSNLTIKGSNNTNTTTGAFLNTATFNGILKISGSYSVTNAVFQTAGYSIPSTGGVWLNNSSFTIAGLNGSPTMSGLLRITAGTWNVGTSSGNSMSSATTSKFYFEGGASNFAGRLQVSSTGAYIEQSNGTITVQTVGNSSSSYSGYYIGSGAIWVMKGGSIVVSLANTASYYDYYNASSTRTYTGGSIQFGNAGSASAKTYRVFGYLPNTQIDGSYAHILKAGYTTGTTSATYALFLGSLTIPATTTYQTNTWTTVIYGDIVNNGAIVGTTAYDRFDFVGTVQQNYSGSGTFGTTAAPFTGWGVGLANAMGVNLSAPIVTTRVNLFTGQFNSASQISLGGGGSAGVFVQRGGAATGAAGSFDVSPTFNLGTGTYGVSYYSTTSMPAVTTGPEIPTTRTMTNMTVNTANGVTLAGGNLALNGTLTMTNGILTTGPANMVTINNTAAGGVSGGTATSYVNGPMARVLPASLVSGSTYTFPIGKTAYQLFELVNPTTGAGGTVTVQTEVFDADCGGTPGTNMSALNTDNYWVATMTSGAANFTNTTVRLTESGMTTNSGLAQSATQTGAYNLISSTPPSGSTIISDAVTSLDYFAIGTKSVPMVYSSSTVTQASTATVLQSAADQVVIGIQIVTTGNITPIDVTKFTVNGNGTTAVGDISNAKIWSTGTSATFATGTQFGTTVASPTLTSFDITGLVTLSPGTNYFWLTYDIPLNATVGHVVDAECTTVTVGGSDYTPTVTAPAGTRTIVINPPSGLTATPFSASQIDLAWTKNTANQDVIIATNGTSTFGTPVNGTSYIVGGTIVGGGTVIYIGPLNAFNHTGLTGNTAYYYKAWSVDANSYYSTGITANATTPCAAISTLPYNDGFETGYVDQGIFGNCWIQQITGYSWTANSTVTSYNRTPRTGTWDAYLHYSANSWMFKKFTLVGGTSYDASIWAKQDMADITYASMEIMYGTTATSAGMTNTIAAPVGLNTAYQQVIGSFTPAASGDYYIGFHGVISGTPWYITIDDIEVRLTPSCPDPINLAATNITSSAADLGWTATGATSYDIEYGPAGFTLGTGTQILGVTNPYTLLGLTSNTAYSYYVRSNCPGPITSNWSGPKTFTTLCDPFTALNENFDGVTAPALPGCWNKYTSPSYTYETVTTYTGSPNTSPNCVQLYSSGATLPADAPMLITPVLSNLSAGTHQLRFYAKGASTNVSVIVGTMSDPANSATFTPFATISGLSTTNWNSYTVDFTTYAGSNTYIAFQHPLTTTYSYIYIDDVVWEVKPACVAPTGLVATGITNNSAYLGWTPGGTETEWEYVYGVSPLAPPSGSGTYTTSNPTQITGLTGNTTYQFYVRAQCSPTSFSTWSGPYSFTTACDPIAVLPWTEGFESVTIPNMPACWNRTTGSGWITTNNANSTYDADAHTGTQFLRESWLATNEYVWTPGFALTASSSYDFSFWWAGDNYADWDGDVWVNTTPDGTGATQLGTAFVVNTTTTTKTYAKVTNTFVPTTTGTYYFAIRVNDATGNPWYLSFDDFTVEETPACPAPTALQAIPSATDASLSWTSTASTFDIEFGLTGFTPDGTPEYTGVSNPYIVTPLLPNTSYDYYVRAICGATTSSWAGPYTFKTPCNVTTAPFTEGFEGTAFAPDCWSLAVISGTYNWTRSTAASGYGSGTASAYANFYSQSSGTYELISPVFSTGTMTAPILKFDYAYATYSGEADEMDVYYSTDAGHTWNLLLAMPGGSSGILNTGGTTTSSFVPTAAQWGTQSLALPTGTNQVKFQAISQYGNNLYLDNVKVLEPYAHDVMVTSIDFLAEVTGFAPLATVYNEGTNTETFDVTLTIGTYTSTKTVTGLAPATSAQVTFDACTATPAYYTAQACTQLATDQQTSNDCLSKEVMIMYAGAGVWTSGTVFPTTVYLGTGVGYTDTSVNPPAGYMFSIGGNTGSTLGTECYKYDVTANTWTAVASLPAGRRVLASACVGNYIYAIGGSDMSSVYQSTVYKYDIAANSWSSVASMPGVLGWCKAVGWGDYVYVAGGYNGTTIQSAVLLYNTLTDTWSTATSMPAGKFGGAFSVTGNTLVYAAGADDLGISSSVYVGTIDTGTPTTISWITAKNPYPGSTSVPTASNIRLTAEDILQPATGDPNKGFYPAGAMYRFDAAPWGADGVIMAAGSPSATWVAANPNPCYVYKPADDTWTKEPDLVTPVLGPALGSVSSNNVWKLIVAGGLDATGATTTATQILTETLLPPTKALTLSLLLEGEFVSGGTMYEAADDMGPHWGTGIADRITVQLNDGTTGAFVWSSSTVDLGTDGVADIAVPATHSGSYWITVSNRNHLVVCSADPVSFTGGAISFAFDDLTKVYGNTNLKLMEEAPDYYALFSGDANQDTFIDSADFSDVDNDVTNFLSGYLPSDVNGDSYIDTGDFTIIDNNNALFLFGMLPY